MRVRLSAGVVGAVLVGLLVASGAAASTAAPKMVLVVSWVAGHPVSIACDADTNPSPFPAAPGTVATAWTYTGGNVIHADAQFCDDSYAKPGSYEFAVAAEVFLHEAARAKGFASDSCVELYADLGVYDVLRRFYNVPFFSPLSEQVGRQVLAGTRTLTANYQPEACWATGTLR